MELAEIVLYVRDMKRAVGFYRDTLCLEVDFESDHQTTFRTGACTLALVRPNGASPAPARPTRHSA